jgi:hypothetical protein
VITQCIAIFWNPSFILCFWLDTCKNIVFSLLVSVLGEYKRLNNFYYFIDVVSVSDQSKWWENRSVSKKIAMH